MNRFFLLFILLSTVLLFSCQSGSCRFDVNISDIEVENIKIHRYGKALFEVDRSNLKEELKRLQPQYSVFLNGDLDDTLSIIQLSEYINDTLLIAVSDDCFLTFPDLNSLEEGLTNTFKYLKYYYPEKNIPAVFTYISGFDYEYPVQYFEDNLLIALDMYLGETYTRYYNLGLPKYILKKFSNEYIIRDCMSQMAKSEIDYKKIGNALLDAMINEGKILWYIEAMTPGIKETIIIDYTEEQLQWAKDNEGNIWAFMIESNLLYSKEMQVMQKFIYDSPFTSYFGQESPPRLGWWIGWKIVRSYMEKNSVTSLNDLMKDFDAQKILSQSGYKPQI